MRESDRLGSWWVREGGRLKERERERERQRERRGSETDVPKLHIFNEYEHSVADCLLSYLYYSSMIEVYIC